MLSLALRTLRFRMGGFVATFIAMFFGTAVIMACGGLMVTGVANAVPPQRLAAVPVVVVGDQHNDSSTLAERVRLDEAKVAVIASVPGVAKAVPDVSFPATVVRDGRPVTEPGDGGTRSFGHGWQSAQLTPYLLTAGGRPDGAGQVVLDAALAQQASVSIGDRVDIVVSGRPQRFTLSGIARQAGGRPADRPAVFFSDAQAQSLAGHPGSVDAVGVALQQGADLAAVSAGIQQAVGDQTVVTLSGDDRGLAEFPQAANTRQNLVTLSAIFGGWAIMVAMFGASSTLGLTVAQRHREMALMKAIGATPGQLRLMILGETLVISVIASVLGTLPGAALSALLYGKLIDAGLASSAVELRIGWIPVAVAVGASLLAAVGAAYITARKVVRTRVTEAMAASVTEGPWLTRTRVILSVVFLAGGVSMAVMTMTMMTGDLTASTAGPACIMWAIGLALLSPGFTRAIVALLKGPLHAVSGVSGRLAVLNAKAYTVRMAATITPIILLTGIATGTLYMQQIEDASNRDAHTGILRADAVLTSSIGGLDAGLLGRVRQVPGVAAASGYVSSTGFVQSPQDPGQTGDGWPLQGVSPGNLSVHVASGNLAALDGDTVALPVERARALDRGVGDTITLRLGDGAPAKVRIVATYQAGGESTALLLPPHLLAPHTTDGAASQILVRLAGRADHAQVTAELTAIAEDRPGVQVSGSGALTAARTAGQQQLATINYLVVGMIVGYTAISVVNTLIAATGRRRREFGLQRLTGFTRRQVMTMMSLESALTAIIGTVLGSVASTVTLFPYSVAKLGQVVPAAPLWIYFTIVTATLIITFTATLLPTWRATRFRPVEATTTVA
ncbi:putative ABC transport system permease protein [Streptosporangium album]|uniref:Putative ABC transport system permease protein n=1 Tax=Streptosporangium album TaxID=47479 RepID=A0A7W7RTB9_9ACTN|nr:FtsX-like permease family protein [Streptosporangium album]MBB4937787.1 putative ABC transport system permease protein [Streptosporangium album]